nr:MAG TPA: hypothetical protein [Caudoviricetes sp.]
MFFQNLFLDFGLGVFLLPISLIDFICRPDIHISCVGSLLIERSITFIFNQPS